MPATCVSPSLFPWMQLKTIPICIGVNLPLKQERKRNEDGVEWSDDRVERDACGGGNL